MPSGRAAALLPLRRWGIVLAIAASLAALAAPGDAHAHASLVETRPARGSVLDDSPASILLRFSEAVETSLGGVRVYGPDGAVVETGAIARPDRATVSVPIAGSLADGTYTVSWRVVSEDTHPIAGAFAFSVGAPSAGGTIPSAQALEAAETPEVVSVTFTAVRFLAFMLVMLCVGGTALLALALQTADEQVRRRVLGAIALSAGALVLVSLSGVVLQGATAAGGGFGKGFAVDVVGQVSSSRFGEAWLARAGLAAALAALLVFARRGRWGAGALDVALVLCIGLAITPAVGGHASSEGVAAFVSDVVHVQAAAIWGGGLVFLGYALAVAGRRRWELAREAVPRFSTMAVVSVALLLAAGIVNGYLEVRTWSGLWETTYGRLLLAKAALILPLLAIGLYNNRRSTTRLRAGAVSRVERRRFLRAVGVEVGVVVAVVAVTSVLVAEPPARAVLEAREAAAAAAERPPSHVAVARLGDLRLAVNVTPSAAGSNQVNLSLSDPKGFPAPLDEITLYATLPERDVGPLAFEATTVESGYYQVPAAELSLPGEWRLRIEGRRGEFELLTTTVSIPIG